MFESQPMGSHTLAWRMVDAASGPVVSGTVRATDLLDPQQWERDTARVHTTAWVGGGGSAGVDKTERQ